MEDQERRYSDPVGCNVGPCTVEVAEDTDLQRRVDVECCFAQSGSCRWDLEASFQVHHKLRLHTDGRVATSAHFSGQILSSASADREVSQGRRRRLLFLGCSRRQRALPLGFLSLSFPLSGLYHPRHLKKPQHSQSHP